MTVTDDDIIEFLQKLTGYGEMDVVTAIEKFKDVHLDPEDLAEAVREYAESIGIEIGKVDVCYVAYEYILNKAREQISEALGFDICNDIDNDRGYYTYGNFYATGIDYSEAAENNFRAELKKADQGVVDAMLGNDCVRVFLKDANIDIDKVRAEKAEVCN